MRLRRVYASLALTLALGVGGVAIPAAASASTHNPVKTHAVKKATSSTYPFAAANPSQVDPWGAEVRQCTSYASWWLSLEGVKISSSTGIRGPKGSAQLGNAAHWDTAARQAGFLITSRPVVGAIAQWHANERSTWSVAGGFSYLQAGADGHVGVVRQVFADGTALIQDYNGAVPLGMHLFHGRAPRYLFIPV